MSVGWLQHVAEGFAGLQRHLIPPLYLARGCYFRLNGRGASLGKRLSGPHVWFGQAEAAHGCQHRWLAHDGETPLRWCHASEAQCLGLAPLTAQASRPFGT